MATREPGGTSNARALVKKRSRTDVKTGPDALTTRADAPRFGHDIVVIGGSAGALEPLTKIVSMLPPTFAASLLVVVHRAADSPQLLAQILRREAGLDAVEAVDGTPIEHGVIYIAPSDRHLLIEEGAVRVIRGPKENRHRPAIDPLFRSAAWSYGPRVIGVLLSGGLSDGTAGLWAIRTCGGTTIVQDPDDARFASMPRSAIASLDPDYCVNADDIANILARVVSEPAKDRRDFPVPEQVKLESQMVQMDNDDIAHIERIGKLSPFTCPSCHGSLWEIDDKHVLRYRCHTGHGFTAESLAEDEDDTVEGALFSALRALEESALLARRLAQRAQGVANVHSARSWDQKARDAERNADILRGLLYSGAGSEKG